MPLATIRQAGERDLYHIHFLDGSHPDHDLPGFPGRPGQLPARPGRPVDPGYGRPEGGIPDHDLPVARPPTLLPGWSLILVRSADGKWHYASLAPSSPPPRPLPEPTPPGGAPDQGLPPQPPEPAPTPTRF